MRTRRGFQLPQVRTVSARLALAVVAVSLVCALVPGVVGVVALAPHLSLGRLFLWQPLTYSLLAVGPLGIIFDALIVWQIGMFLEMTWGPRRMLSFALGVTVLSGVLTLALALLLPLGGEMYAGAQVMSISLWVGYGLYVGRGQTNFWGLPVTGNVLALIGVAFILISAASRGVYGFLGVIPEMCGMVLTVAYIRGIRPRVLFLRFQSWRQQRQIRNRSRHLNVLDGGKGSRGSDRYLH